MPTIDMAKVESLRTAALHADLDANAASSYALSNHTAYVQALKTNQSAWDAWNWLRVEATQDLSVLDASAHPDWKATLTSYHDEAMARLGVLVTARQAIKNDLAAHLSFKIDSGALPASAATLGPDAMAAASDKADKASPPATITNPNAASPGKQSTDDPPVAAPPPDTSTWGEPLETIGLVALIGGGLWLAAKVFMRKGAAA